MQALKGYFKQLMFGLMAAAVLLGLKVYNKGQSHDNMKADLIKMCESEKPCIKAVNKHFDSCFDSAYKTGGRRKADSFNQGQFLSCFNQRAGKTYFSVAEHAH
jgi:hypothetical protein